jgi:hypothetical protein
MIMERRSFLFLLALGILLICCKKTDSNPIDNTELIIKAGYVCGWGTGTDSIEISESGIKYVYYIPSISQQPKISKTRPISDVEWSEILGEVNMDDFVKLKYQTCNVCVDGCDEWIYIQKDKITHKITFGQGLKIDTISKLQDKLSQLKKEFNN